MMQVLPYVQHHRQTIFRSVLCIILFVLAGISIQWWIPSSASLAFKGRLFCSGLALALSLFLWNYSRFYIGAFCLYTIIFLSSSLMPMLAGQHIQRIEVTAAYLVGAALFLFFTDLIYISRHIRKKSLRCVLDGLLYVCMVAALLFPLLIWGYYAVSGHVLSATIVLTLFQTNGSESLAYLKSQNLFVWGGTFAALIFILIGSGSVLYRLKTPSGSYPKKIVCMLFVFILAISGYMSIRATNYLPVRIAIETKDALHQYKEYGKAKAQREDRLQQLQGLRITSDGGIFVLVIGESETRDHMGAYGYDRDTTPWMSEEAQKPEAILFRNAYSNHTHTVPVLTYALSEKNQYNDVPLEKAYSLIEIAKAAGYDTFWLSNQRKYGAWDTPVAEIASTAVHQAWLNERTGTHDLRSDYYDDALVQALPDLTNEKNALIVIHLMGCHGSYADRYPEEWKHYSGKSDVIDKYDNAIRYNDYVLQQLYEALKENPRFKGFVYFSDHGEDVEHNYGHEASKFTATMSHIPLFMVISPAFQAERPQTVETLRSHRDSYWTNDLIYNVMTDLLGIDGVPGTDLDWDLASPQYSMTKDTLRTLHGKQVLQ